MNDDKPDEPLYKYFHVFGLDASYWVNISRPRTFEQCTQNKNTHMLVTVQCQSIFLFDRSTFSTSCTLQCVAGACLSRSFRSRCRLRCEPREF